jgi:hypothetical protein
MFERAILPRPYLMDEEPAISLINQHCLIGKLHTPDFLQLNLN